jgi:hypothetical protein
MAHHQRQLVSRHDEVSPFKIWNKENKTLLDTFITKMKNQINLEQHYELKM